MRNKAATTIQSRGVSCTRGEYTRRSQESERSQLVTLGMKDSGDHEMRFRIPVIDQIVARWEASDLWADVFAAPPGFGLSGE